jgi:hypothetical protein
MLALRAFTYELKYETADDKRSSCRKHRASASADTLTFARSGSCDKLSRSALSNASTRSRRPGGQAILRNPVLDEMFLGHCMAVVLQNCTMKFWCHVQVCSRSLHTLSTWTSAMTAVEPQ